MSQAVELKATVRHSRGKGGARAVRREGRVPAVIYGDNREPENISVDYIELFKQMNTGAMLSTIYILDVDGKKTRVLPKDIQTDPVRDFPIHVDFMRLAKDAEVNVFVPVQFINHELSPGIKRGGVLSIVRHEVELYCPADQIPEHITADLTGYEIGDSLHISAITLPNNVRPVIADRDFTVASIAGSKAVNEASS